MAHYFFSPTIHELSFSPTYLSYSYNRLSLILEEFNSNHGQSDHDYIT